MAKPVKRTIHPPAYIGRADKAFEDNDIEGFCSAFRTHKEFSFYCKQVHDVERRMRSLYDDGTLSGQGLAEYETLVEKVDFVDKAAAVYKKRQEQEVAHAQAEEKAEAERREQDEECNRNSFDEDKNDSFDEEDKPEIGRYMGPIGIELM